MGAIYNEIEPYAVAWLRNLEIAGHIAQGRVDERSIRDLKPDDVREFTQAHFFAGIGVWSHALRLAGWPDELPVWTGSCPCQPFSGAGKRGGFADDRHLWPDWFRLIRECRPPVVFGEQVAGPDGARWLDLVQTDMEGADYAFGAAVLPAAGVGAPHIRHRIYWVAYAAQVERGQGRPGEAGIRARPTWVEPDGLRAASPVAHAHDAGLLEQRSAGLPAVRDASRGHDADGRGEARGVADADQVGRLGRQDDGGDERDGPDSGRAQVQREFGACRQDGRHPTNGFWARAEWVPCRDGYSRPVEPGTQPLAYGATQRVGPGGALETQPRVGKLRAYGNAIVAEVAATFIRAVMESALTEAA